MKYQENKGKICSVSGCNNIARVKGLCMECYGKRKKEQKEDIEHETFEEMLEKDITQFEEDRHAYSQGKKTTKMSQ